MSTIENEAWVEAVALATINDRRGRHGWPPMNTIPDGFHNADEWRAQARAAIRALLPLIIERCAEVAKRHAEEHARSLDAYSWADVDSGWWRLKGHIEAGVTLSEDIRALIQKEASDG